MNRTLITTLLLAFLLLFIISPFGALASLMLLLVGAAFLFFLSNIFLAIIGSSNSDSNA